MRGPGWLVVKNTVVLHLESCAALSHHIWATLIPLSDATVVKDPKSRQASAGAVHTAYPHCTSILGSDTPIPSTEDSESPLSREQPAWELCPSPNPSPGTGTAALQATSGLGGQLGKAACCAGCVVRALEQRVGHAQA